MSQIIETQIKEYEAKIKEYEAKIKEYEAKRVRGTCLANHTLCFSERVREVYPTDSFEVVVNKWAIILAIVVLIGMVAFIIGEVALTIYNSCCNG
jgi:hypothetical protein